MKHVIYLQVHPNSRMYFFLVFFLEAISFQQFMVSLVSVAEVASKNSPLLEGYRLEPSELHSLSPDSWRGWRSRLLSFSASRGTFLLPDYFACVFQSICYLSGRLVSASFRYEDAFGLVVSTLTHALRRTKCLKKRKVLD